MANGSGNIFQNLGKSLRSHRPVRINRRGNLSEIFFLAENGRPGKSLKMPLALPVDLLILRILSRPGIERSCGLRRSPTNLKDSVDCLRLSSLGNPLNRLPHNGFRDCPGRRKKTTYTTIVAPHKSQPTHHQTHITDIAHTRDWIALQ